MYYVLGKYQHTTNVLDISIFHSGKILGTYQVPIQGLEFRERRDIVKEVALRDITKNRLVAWALADTLPVALPEDYPFWEKGSPVFYKFGPNNTRITIHTKEE
jgi:hypothetical protein